MPDFMGVCIVPCFEDDVVLLRLAEGHYSGEYFPLIFHLKKEEIINKEPSKKDLLTGLYKYLYFRDLSLEISKNTTDVENFYEKLYDEHKFKKIEYNYPHYVFYECVIYDTQLKLPKVYSGFQFLQKINPSDIGYSSRILLHIMGRLLGDESKLF